MDNRFQPHPMAAGNRFAKQAPVGPRVPVGSTTATHTIPVEDRIADIRAILAIAGIAGEDFRIVREAAGILGNPSTWSPAQFDLAVALAVKTACLRDAFLKGRPEYLEALGAAAPVVEGAWTEYNELMAERAVEVTP